MISICSLWIGTAAVNSHYFSGGADPPGRPCHFNCISVEEVTGGTEGSGVKQRSSVPHNKNGCQCSRKKKRPPLLNFSKQAKRMPRFFLLIPEEFFFYHFPRSTADVGPRWNAATGAVLASSFFFLFKKISSIG